jgi:surfeit locus 1 family protein
MSNGVASFLARRRFRPKLLPTIGLVILLAATVGLGNWQRHRAAEKQAMRDQLERAAREPVLELPAAITDPARLRFRSVRAVGEYDASRQIFIDNKVQAGRVGYHVVAPLKLPNDRYVLVDRGWIAQGARRSELPEAPPPTGPVIIEGRINMPPARYLEFGSQKSAGKLWQNLDIERIAEATGLPLLPFVIEQTNEAHDGLVRDWPPPDFGVAQHQSYMLQWYSLAALGCVLWLTLNWRVEGVDHESRRG